MTSADPLEPSEGSFLPPRHRPKLADLNKDTLERDLWDLDDMDGGGSPAEPVLEEADKDVPPEEEKRSEVFLKPREIGGKNPEHNPAKTSSKVDVIRRKKGKVPGDFDDLDSDDAAFSSEELEEPVAVPVKGEAAGILKTEEIPISESETMLDADVERGESSPQVQVEVAKAFSKPLLGLSKVEKIGMGVLLAVLLLGGIWFLVQSFSDLPKESAARDSPDFPVEGKWVKLVSSTTYWRIPITEGENADTARRGTELLPVMELKTEGNVAAIRIFFRNGEGEVVGDPVTRTVSGTSSLNVAATAGFDDLGMYTAYRTGLSKPWTVEIHEGPSASAPSSDFSKILKMNISPERR